MKEIITPGKKHRRMGGTIGGCAFLGVRGTRSDLCFFSSFAVCRADDYPGTALGREGME
jgi:hypothetical protein